MACHKGIAAVVSPRVGVFEEEEEKQKKGRVMRIKAIISVVIPSVVVTSPDSLMGLIGSVYVLS